MTLKTLKTSRVYKKFVEKSSLLASQYTLGSVQEKLDVHCLLYKMGNLSLPPMNISVFECPVHDLDKQDD